MGATLIVHASNSQLQGDYMNTHWNNIFHIQKKYIFLYAYGQIQDCHHLTFAEILPWYMLTAITFYEFCNNLFVADEDNGSINNGSVRLCEQIRNGQLCLSRQMQPGDPLKLSQGYLVIACLGACKCLIPKAHAQSTASVISVYVWLWRYIFWTSLSI